jgi:hypothetical protein
MQLQAQENPKALISTLNRKFNLVQDYTADVKMVFDIPGVKMNNMNGKVFFKRPNKFRIKAKGIFFMPKQNPMQNISTLLLDTSAYTSVISGYETIDGRSCAIINIIPLKTEGELILGKFWIDKLDPLVRKSQITTKNNGTIESSNTYSSNAAYTLPDQIVIKVEVNKFKVPKMMSVDLNKKSKEKDLSKQKETGTIRMDLVNYKINTKLQDAVFVDGKE